MPRALIGSTFGKWAVIGTAPKRGNDPYWLCRCACGSEREVQENPLVHGRTLCCGCEKKPRKPLEVIPRIKRYTIIDPDTGCWVWQHKKNNGGYGTISVNGRQMYAHRASYEAYVGRIPDGLVIDHLCRNRACVNPSHLEPVSFSENLERGVGVPQIVNRHKTHCVHGHLLSGDNLYQRNDGRRGCNVCRKLADQKRGARRKAEREAVKDLGELAS